ncbi:MAG: thioesterase family protein [Planctomycetota bacterium]|nr:thioesterase family protein [Planctomycetota bacterium]MDA1212399.1 thioesterase family protein [Planctomycetota bacterium]
MLREHTIEFRVRYSETDAMGFLYHGNYAPFFEMGRTELFRAQGGNYREMEERGYFFVVAKLTTQFHAPAKYDDLLQLNTRVTRLSPAKLEHEYKLYRDGTLIASASSVLGCLDRAGNIQRISEVLGPAWEEFSS